MSEDFAVAVNGVELKCTTVGCGPAVVFLHAGGEKRSVWAPVAERIAPCGFRAISVDQRGHGETEGPVGESLDLYAGDLRALLSWLDGPAQLVGASLGGLASVLALADSATRARVTGLVLVDVVPDPEPTRARAFLRRLEADGSPSRAPQWGWTLVEDILSRSVELRQAVGALRVPVTLVRGTASEALREEEAQRFRAVVGHVVLREVDGAGHLVARDRPAELADALLEHFARAPVGARHQGGHALM